MENSGKNILFQAAEAWMNLTKYRYIFTYGYKNTLHTITLVFAPSDFPHLAGFHYMKDISVNPRFSHKKLLQKILDGTVDTTPFLHAAQFESSVVPRLHALIRLKESLDNDFNLFQYMPQFYPFFTNIKADYLISSHIEDTDYIFIISSHDGSASVEYTCCSIFEKNKRDYEEGQRERILLKKERVHIPSNQKDILYDRLSLSSEK